jgi:hypothetical protein
VHDHLHAELHLRLSSATVCTPTARPPRT